MAIKGLAGYGMITNDPITSPAQQVALFPRISSVEITEDVTQEDIKAFTGDTEDAGEMNAVDSIIKGILTGLNVSFQSWDAQDLAAIYREQWATTSSYELPVRFSGIVPTGSPYEVSNSLIVGTEGSGDVFVTLKSDNNEGDPEYLEVGTDVTFSAGKLTFNSAFAGRNFYCAINKTYSNVRTLGVETNFDPVMDLSYFGLLTGTRLQQHRYAIKAPNLSRIDGFNLTLSDGAAEGKMSFRAKVTGANRKAIHIIEYDV